MSDVGKQPVKAAFEIKKGARQLMTLSETEVERYLDPKELLDGLEDGFRGIELGEVQSPPRPKLSVAGQGFSLAMPAWRPGMQLTVKIVNVFDGNLEIGLPYLGHRTPASTGTARSRDLRSCGSAPTRLPIAHVDAPS